MASSWIDMARLGRRRFGMRNGGWAFDAYPELETLDAGRSITVAEIEGPAVITQIHVTQHSIRRPLRDEGMTDEEAARLCARGVVLEVYFNGVGVPAVRAPLADFFADGCCGRAEDFSSLYVEKAPGAYNCFFPMPFEKSARVVLKNETKYNVNNYTFVEFERMPKWERDLGYFHATWRRFAFQLHGRSDEHFFRVDGKGHLVGRAWSISTDEPMFEGFHFVMEGNNEVRIDGEEDPRADYLGSECSFGFCWGFPRTFTSLRHGINFVRHKEPSLLSVYRFRDRSVIGFERSLDCRIDWSNEFLKNEKFQKEMSQRHDVGGGWIDYATTFYWYQSEVGYEHGEMISLGERVKAVLHRNPEAAVRRGAQGGADPVLET